MPTYNLSPGTVSEYVTTLKKAGYDSVFDIIAKSRADFIKSVPDMEDSRARQTYHQARNRAHVLKSLYRSWQLRQEPVIGRLKKLAPSPSPLLKDTLLRNIGGDGDFSDLMERSTDYADAASIQSLFSPGRYAVALYKVAKAFHEEGSALDIDTRRPDLKDLILSETTMNQEITSLDLLLEMLQGNDSNKLNALSTSFFPMTLPYDDRLTQISAALDAQGRTLNGIWDSLSDTLASSFAADGQLTRSTPFSEEVSGRKIFLKTDDKMVFLAHATAGGAHLPGAHLNAGKPDAEEVLVAPLHITRKDGLFYLGIEGDITLNNISLSGCYLMADSGEDNGNEGNYARMGNTGAHLNPTTYLPITLEQDGGNGTWLKTSKGYIGIGSSGAIDWPTPLTVAEPSTATALSFSFCSDESGNNPVSPDASLPPNTAPNPPARTILNLTPVSYQLMANEELTETDIIRHYGLENSQQRSVGDLATQLNDIPTFCEKTGLTFNQLLDLTAQFSYARAGGKKGTANHPMSHFKKYGATFTADVDEYGAAFINSGVDKNIEDIFLWVQPEQRDAAGNITTAAALNFTDDTLVSLAGNAEKLIRLHTTTDLPFEMLDWVIVNASRAAGYDSPKLDSRVLEALAACVDLQKGYGITPNTFVSFIGPVNPYGREKVNSLYAELFIYPDQTGHIPFNANIKINDSVGLYESTCHKALGVTSDEFTRIGGYCFGKNADTFRMTEYSAGQIYRFGAIPRMLGLTFAEAECLWKLMAGGTDELLVALGKDTGFAAIVLIRRTEQVLRWMAENNLNLIQIQAMVSTVYSGTATAEMFTFLQNVYHSVKDIASATPGMDDALQQKVWRALAGGFGLKTNVMGPVTTWLSKTDTDFTLDGYWSDIAAFFGDAKNTSVEDLQHDTGLVEATQRLSQLVLVTRWLNLSEQDMTLLTGAPEQLDSSLSVAPRPDLSLLLLLTRFKRWQSQVTTSVDEALRLLPLLADIKSPVADVAEKIAAMHNLTVDSVISMNTLLFGDGRFPDSFAQLYTLLTWLRTGQVLNVGTAALHDLLTMAQSNPEAEDKNLITRVADALTAGLTR